MTGLWRVSFSLISRVDDGLAGNRVYIFHNHQQMRETEHYTDSKYYEVWSTGGRELITRVEQGDTFHLGTERMNNWFYQIITCFEFVSL